MPTVAPASPHPRIRGALPHLGAFAVLLGPSLWLFPRLALVDPGVLPNWLSNYLFFWPQLVLAPYGFICGAPGSPVTYWGSQFFPLAAYVFWSVVACAYAVAIRRRPLYFTFLLTYPIVFTVAELIGLLLRLFDIFVYLEGL